MAFIGRPTRAEIDLDALGFNLKSIQELGDGAEILAVVKADAYGHGDVRISSELAGRGVNYFGVATCREGEALRKAGIKDSIVILGGIYRGEAKEVIKYDFTPVIYTIESARNLSIEAKKRGRKVKVQIKIDTGMGRIGVLPGETKNFFLKIKDLENIDVDGILSHLAVADREEAGCRDFTFRQLDNFQETLKRIRDYGFHPKWRHIANSSAIITYPHSLFNMIRPGLMLYGSYPFLGLKEKVALKPLMSLKTEIIHLKKVTKGFSVSYGRSFICKRESLIATLPVGYADGFPRALSNRGDVLIRGKRAPVAGTVCMDMTMVDVTNISEAAVGDEVVVMGSQGEDTISVEEVAEKAGSIAYEILCGISKRVPRVYFKGEKVQGYDG